MSNIPWLSLEGKFVYTLYDEINHKNTSQHTKEFSKDRFLFYFLGTLTFFKCFFFILSKNKNTHMNPYFHHKYYGMNEGTSTQNPILYFISSSFLLARTTIAKKKTQYNLNSFNTFMQKRVEQLNSTRDNSLFLIEEIQTLRKKCNKSISRRSSRIIDVQVPSAI